MILWQLSGLLDGQTVHAAWDDDRGGLVADADLWVLCADLEESGTVVQATPTGPSWPAGIGAPDVAWATVRYALDEVTDEVGEPPGYPWDVPEDAIC